MSYVTIDIHVTRDDTQPETYLVAATTRRKAAQATFQLSSTFRKDLELLLKKLHARTLPQEDERNIQSFGEALFAALIRGEVQALYDERLKSAQQNGSGLQLCLYILPPELIVLPWELLYDRRQAEYLCLTEHPKILILRRSAQVRRTRPATYNPPLRVLLMAASPTDLPRLAVEQEEKDIRDALQQLVEKQQVLVESKPGTSLALQDLRLDEQPIHTYHFLGHGTFDPQHGEGQLSFENEHGTTKRISVAQFRRSLPAETQLVVLNACQTAQGNESTHFSSIAASLASKGIPAVVAMQFNISDPAAVRFAKVFYTSLAKGLGVDEAVAEARLGIATADRSNHLDWAAPVLYMGSSNSRIFVMGDTKSPREEEKQKQPSSPEPPPSPKKHQQWFFQHIRLIAAVLSIVLLLGLLARFIIPPNGSAPITLCVATDLPNSSQVAGSIEFGAQLALTESPLSTDRKYSNYKITIDTSQSSSSADGQSADPNKGVEILHSLLSNPPSSCPNPIAVIGPYDSASAQAEIPVANTLQLPLLSPSNTVVCLTQQSPCVTPGMTKPSHYYFRVVSTDNSQALVAANFLISTPNSEFPQLGGLGAQKIDIVENSDIYGTDLASLVHQDLSRSTSTELYCIRADQSTPSCPSGVTSFASTSIGIGTLVKQIQTDNPGAIFFAGLSTANAGSLCSKLDSNVPFVGGSSLAADATTFFNNGCGRSNVYVTFPSIDLSPFAIQAVAKLPLAVKPTLSHDASTFASQYSRQPDAGLPGGYSVNGYDTASIILQAIKRVIDGGRAVTRANVADALHNEQFQGLFEPDITFNSSGDNNVPQPWYTIYQSQKDGHGGWDWQLYTEEQA